MDASLAPLGLQDIRVLNCLDDWLILAHSRELVSYHRDIVLHHIHALGLRTNTKKSVLTHSRETVFLGVYLDSVQMQARLAPAWISSFNTCLARFKRGHHVSVSTCRRLLGLMATASPVLLLAHKLPGAQSRLPGTNLLSLLSQEVSCDSQDGQHGGGIPHKSPWGSRSHTLNRLARCLLLWSQDKFLSLRAVHVPAVLNLAANFLSRPKLRPGEWLLNRQTVAQIWDLFGEAEVYLFASQESSQSPLWFSLSSLSYWSSFLGLISSS